MILWQYVEPSTDRVIRVSWDTVDGARATIARIAHGIGQDVVAAPMGRDAEPVIYVPETGEMMPVRWDALLGWSIVYGGDS